MTSSLLAVSAGLVWSHASRAEDYCADIGAYAKRETLAELCKGGDGVLDDGLPISGDPTIVGTHALLKEKDFAHANLAAAGKWRGLLRQWRPDSEYLCLLSKGTRPSRAADAGIAPLERFALEYCGADLLCDSSEVCLNDARQALLVLPLPDALAVMSSADEANEQFLAKQLTDRLKRNSRLRAALTGIEEMPAFKSARLAVRSAIGSIPRDLPAKVDAIRGRLLEVLAEFQMPSETREALEKRIRLVTVDTRGWCNGAFPPSGGYPMSNRAVYYHARNQIEICAGWYYRPKSDAELIFTLAHEMAHAISPSMLKLKQGVLAPLVKPDSPELECERNPFYRIVKCLDPRVCTGKAAVAGDAFGETLSDYFANRVLASTLSASRPALDASRRRNAFANQVFAYRHYSDEPEERKQVCSGGATDTLLLGDAHLSDDARLNLALRLKQTREVLGCPSPPQTPVCEPQAEPAGPAPVSGAQVRSAL